jgi:hypothetical protein
LAGQVRPEDFREHLSYRRTKEKPVLRDILIALVITIVAVVLGIAVHPALFFLVVLAVVWLVVGHRSHRARTI